MSEPGSVPADSPPAGPAASESERAGDSDAAERVETVKPSAVPRRRIIGELIGARPGPLIIAVGTIHGNEPAGSLALERFFRDAEALAPKLSGRVLGLLGNRAALEADERYIDTDLNRAWTPERVAQLRSDSPPDDAEAREQLELLPILDRTLAEHDGPVVFLDLHTSSGHGPPFGTVGDTLRNRRFALSLPVIKVLGIEEQLDGALLEYMNNLGHTTLGFEGGQHRDPGAVERHYAMLRLALVTTGMIRAEDLPDYDDCQATLENAVQGLPEIIEVCSRHSITPEDEFVMEPGFMNFSPVRKGQLLARDRNGPIHAPDDGLIILPLYQGSGNDGFFFGRAVRPVWLKVSALLRRLRTPGLMGLLPGIRRHPEEPRTLVADPRIARFYTTELFHLFGFRRLREEHGRIHFQRRNE